MPPDVRRAAVLRPVQAARDALATAAAGAAASRPRPPVPVPPPDDVLFEPRRDSCPWCGGAALVDRLDTTDLLQHKPGRFHLDECAGCGHVFQNPALSPAGLDHYYAEFYEGEGEEPWEFAFAAMGGAYRKRTDALARHTEPRAWLDVGTGHGHFCLVARQRWPEATFDGLDLSESVEEAARRGWIDAGYRGLFPDLADSLSRSYDVVSMHHYLEHTRDPRLELAAAAKALEPGGHLMIEGPDVDCPWSRRLGPYWRCWFQPQHQHFVTCDNLVAALEGSGFDVVAVERGPATEGMDITSAVTFWVNRTAPDPRSPWRPPPGPGGRVEAVRRAGGRGARPGGHGRGRHRQGHLPPAPGHDPPRERLPRDSSPALTAGQAFSAPALTAHSVQATANGGGSGTSSRLGTSTVGRGTDATRAPGLRAATASAARRAASPASAASDTRRASMSR